MSDLPKQNGEIQSAKDDRNFNYYITKFFLDNTRLTILSLILLVVTGAFTVFNSKTTGFPNPDIGIAIVQTIYPGASSDTIVQDVTQPLEGAIKGVEGVNTYTSFSSNSVSVISVSMNDNVNYDSVQNRIDAAVKSINLPAGAESPKVTKPGISGPNLIFSVAGNDLAKVYEIYTKAVSDLNQLPETASVIPSVDLKKQAVISLDLIKMRAAGVSVDQIESQIKSFGESIPVISDVSLDNQSYSLVTTVSGASLEDIQNIEFLPQQTQNPQAPRIEAKPVKLSDFSQTNIEYNFVKGDKTNVAIRKEDNIKVLPAVVFSVETAANTDQVAYTSKISEKFKNYEGAEYLIGKNIENIPEDKVLLIENFSVNDQNQVQVGEVVSGLVGGKLTFLSEPLSNVGWALGGIQLVFLVMLAFVSWRAAIIAAIAIPMSLVFSTIYLYFIGESLNTLVLFSLVLVIGLVVDPALVILESIQRKVDIGLKGREAVLEAVKDVGNGLFLATLTNLIVFLPFAVISGILGKIFIYIPLTVIPATIGSYLVPLIFLSWLGGLILKPSKNKTDDEEANLWPIAKWLINLNQNILDGSRLVRLIIVVVTLSIPLSLTAYLFSTGQLKSTQFASSDNTNVASISGSFLPEITKQEREETVQKIYDLAIANQNVKQIYLFSNNTSTGSFSLNLELKEASQRDVKSLEIVEKLDNQIQERFGEKSGNSVFFDINADLEQTGPPTSNYQVSIAVKTNDLEKLQAASVEIGKQIQDVCYTKERTVTINSSCDGDRIVKKVDDGFTNKQTKVVEVLLDRQKLQQAQLTVPNAPLSILVNQRLRQLFAINDSKSLISLDEKNDNLEIVLDKNTADPKSVDEIKNVLVTSLSGQPIKLSDVAQITEKTPKSRIQRVKGQTIGLVQVALKDGFTDQGTAALVSNEIVKFYEDESKTDKLGLEKGSIEQYSEGGAAANTKSFGELLVALVLAVFLTYVVLAIFFQSFTQPLVILYTIPLTFLGVFPALAYLSVGEIGFLEIIGIIILIGIVENVAIFLIDSARQKIDNLGWSEKRAISFASGVRLRSVFMTEFTTIASLAPLAVLSQFYRSIALVIMFGLITSGVLSLITTPILFIFFKWLSREYRAMKWYNQVLFFPLFPIYIIVLAIKDRPQKVIQAKISA